jgi:hypothetical protein
MSIKLFLDLIINRLHVFSPFAENGALIGKGFGSVGTVGTERVLFTKYVCALTLVIRREIAREMDATICRLMVIIITMGNTTTIERGIDSTYSHHASGQFLRSHLLFWHQYTLEKYAASQKTFRRCFFPLCNALINSPSSSSYPSCC